MKQQIKKLLYPLLMAFISIGISCLVPYCGGIGLILKDFGLDFHWLMINSHGVNPFRDFNCLAKL